MKILSYPQSEKNDRLMKEFQEEAKREGLKVVLMPYDPQQPCAPQVVVVVDGKGRE